MAVPTDPAGLVLAAACYKCLPTGTQPEVMIYLLNQLLEVPKTVPEMLDGAKCFKCIPAGSQAEVQTYLLSLIANA